jgi:fatty acid desaturase
MTTAEKKNMLKSNTILWVLAMVLPAVFHLAFASTKFPWPLIIPFLLLGALLASNQMLSKAIGHPTDAPKNT